MMQAVIFDMDGTLIDSEPMWKEAEKQVFSSVGVKVSEELSASTASMTTREVTLYCYRSKKFNSLSNIVEDFGETVIVRQAPFQG